VDVIIRKLPEQLTTIRAAYERDLASKEMSDDLLHDTARLIEDCQRALDWTATDIDKTHGPGKDRSPYFPLQADPTKFAAAITKDFSTVPVGVVDAMERHQPYQPGKADLAHLHELTRVNKHQDFTPQTRKETREVTVADPSGGSVSYNDGVRFGTNSISFGPGGGISFGPGGAIGFGPGGVSAQGIRIDPSTQRPVPNRTHKVTDTIYVGWNFVKPAVPVLPTLESLSQLVSEAVKDIRHEAGL
jgi:hypothetical protein